MFDRKLPEIILPWRRSLRLLLAVLLGVQTLIAASHLHSGYVYSANGEMSSRSSGDQKPTADVVDCPICHLLSLMGDAAPPPAVAAILSAILILCGNTPFLGAQAHHAQWSGWRSRGPPAVS